MLINIRYKYAKDINKKKNCVIEIVLEAISMMQYKKKYIMMLLFK